jgi:hypothetical protein
MGLPMTITSLKVFVVAGLIAVLSGSAAFAGDWTGNYMTEDTKGNAFRIMLSGDGKAAGEKDGHVLSGTWTNEGDAALINWDSGWTTKLSKNGDRYEKSAYRAGASTQDHPTHTTGAEKTD